ncbi:MAG: hypothetical protein GQ559_03810, partial [Desulfobulbaceae bacterium]|nr:hypothetical protein [Desulfobulbaceae bacterium]
MVRTSVTPAGVFRVGVHKPSFSVMNLREKDHISALGSFADKTVHDNRQNFPEGDVHEKAGRWIYEIPNAFTFRGTTYIDSGWAASRAKNPDSIRIEKRAHCSLLEVLGKYMDREKVESLLSELPKPVRYDLAANSTDSAELVLLARSCCRFDFDLGGQPTGLGYSKSSGQAGADIDDFELFETIANNPFLPDLYKEVMVLRPGAQGGSEIVGDRQQGETHVFEYFRRNSYIPWGHYAANMANNSIRYRTSDLTAQDMTGLRHLYYQRIYVTLAGKFGIDVQKDRRGFTVTELEELRGQIAKELAGKKDIEHAATLWGWNFGYDFSGSGYRRHASQQVIHQRYAMVPELGKERGADTMESYCCGDLVADTVRQYRQTHDRDFFADYLTAICNNERMDGRPSKKSLIVWEDDNVMLFVPKAQVSQWELQLMVTGDTSEGPVGNVIEA